jgi:hypothetical protein
VEPGLHPIFGLDHGLRLLLQQILALLLLHRILLVHDLDVLEFEVIYALPRLKQLLVLANIVLHALLLELTLGLPTDVQIYTDATRVLGFQSEAIHDIRTACLIEVARPDEFVQAKDAHGATQKEGVDLTHEGATGPPSVDLQLVITWVDRQAQETVALNPMPTPVIH